jgi:hypothetical protein
MDGPDSVWLQKNAAALATPARVAERGVAGPFSTPALFGARVRLGGSEQIEVVIPNPSGRDGWLVLPWSSVLEAFRPTLADRALAQRLGLVPPTPARVRAAAMAVAAEGLGGRPLRRAAEAAAARDAARATQLRAVLAARAPARAAEAPALLDFGLDTAEGALGARMRRVRAFADSLEAWHSSAALAGEQQRARIIAQRAAKVLGPAAGLVAAAREALLAAPAGSPAPPETERAAWLLDGWDLLAALWEASAGEDRVAALRRIAAVVPGVPEEVLAWPGCAPLGGPAAPLPPAAPGATVPAARCEAALALWIAG